MSKLFANRWFRWSLLAIALIGLGVCIYHFTPPEPMCVIEAESRHAYFFADGGRRLITRSGPHAALGFLDDFHQASFQAPLQIWDTRTGERLASHFKEDETFPNVAISRDSRYFALELHKVTAVVEDRVERLDAIALLDISDGTIREIPLEQMDDNLTSLHFSPDGALLVRMSIFDDKALRIFDTTTGTAIDARESSGGYVDSDEPITDTIVHITTAGVEVWSCRDRKVIATLEASGNFSARSPDGRFYVASPQGPEGAVIGKWGVWSLTTGKLAAEFQAENVEPGPISPDGRWLTMTRQDAQGKQLELRALPTGKLMASVPVHDLKEFKFSADGHFLIVEGMQAESGLTMLAVPSLKTLWHQPRSVMPAMLWQLPPDRFGAFSFDSQMLVLAAEDRPEVYCLDCTTGQPRATIPLPGILRGSMPLLRVTPDGRTLLIHQLAAPDVDLPPWRRWLALLPLPVWPSHSNDAVIVYDLVHLRERARIVGTNATFAKLSEDGSTLVTTHEETTGRTIRCWDVNAWKSLHWALGVPAGLAAVIILIGWLRARRKVVGKSNTV